ncbi:MAG: phosphotransferase family protein [Candidatus Acidiferrales bacterium]
MAEQFPDLGDFTALPLGGGYDSQAFEVAGRWIFLFPKSPDSAASLPRQAALLPKLSPRLSMAVPAFRFFGQLSPAYPHPFVGYEKLPGTLGVEVDPARLDFGVVGPALARFLRELHAFPAEEARSLGVPSEIPFTTGARRDEALDDLAVAAGEVGPEEIDRWRRFLAAAPPAWAGPACLVHNDLAAEHVLLDANGDRTGVIDWGDVALGDPAADFAGLVHWGGEPLAQAALAAYGPVDEGLLARARWLAACRGIADIVFGRAFRRPGYVATGLRALRAII